MVENTYLCNQCRNIFKLPLTCSITPGKQEVLCPSCGSSHVEEMPAWKPLGFNVSAGTLMWEYQCQNCQHLFKRPVPSSPSQEKEIKCPECGHWHIHRMSSVGGEPIYCG